MVSDTVHDGVMVVQVIMGMITLMWMVVMLLSRVWMLSGDSVHIAGSNTEFRSVHAHSNILIISYRSKAKIRSKSNITETMMNDAMIIVEGDEKRLNGVRDN